MNLEWLKRGHQGRIRLTGFGKAMKPTLWTIRACKQPTPLLIEVRGHRQKIFVPVNGFCPLGGDRVSPESAKIVILGTKILIRNVAQIFQKNVSNHEQS